MKRIANRIKRLLITALARMRAHLLMSEELRSARQVERQAAKRDQIAWWLVNSVVCEGCGLRVNPSLISEHYHVGGFGSFKVECPPCWEDEQPTRSYPPSSLPTLDLPSSGQVKDMARRADVGSAGHLGAFWLADESLDRIYLDYGGEG